MNGSLFLEKLVFVWVYFQISWRHIPTKSKLEYPPQGSQVHVEFSKSTLKPGVVELGWHSYSLIQLGYKNMHATKLSEHVEATHCPKGSK